MTRVDADLFCDPFAAAQWRHQPVIRHVEYAFPEVAWTVRPVVAHPEPLDGPDADAAATDAERAATAAGLPVNADALRDGVPSSWAACEALVGVRDAAADRALAYLHRLAGEAFAAGRPPASAEALADVAADVDGVDPDAVRDAVGSRRAAAAVGRDAEVARGLLADDDVGVRGDPATLPLAPRLYSDGDPTARASRDDDRDSDDDRSSNDDRDSNDDEAGRGPQATVPAPPLVCIRSGEYVDVVDPATGFDEFVDVLRRIDPDLGDLNWRAQIHGRSAMESYGVEQRAAEQWSNEDYAPQVREVLSTFGEAYLADVAAAANLSADTCRLSLRELDADGDVARTETGAWRLRTEESD
ncbi:hypothetical protein [Halobaculum sp. P14]|uniref:hypothetical protein n=1 Tax=Halobaculum sp. P14 TaxID=3421638 RepID=UPI003EB9C88E